MSDVLGTALSGLLASQRALSVSSHNVANVNTEGYSRQSVNLGTRVPDTYGNGYIGTGVQINDVVRSYDAFAQEQLRSTQSEYGRLESFNDIASRLDALSADSPGNLTSRFDSFFSALQEVATSPDDNTARAVLLSEAEGLTSSFNRLHSDISRIDQDINQRLDNTVDQINAYAQQLAELNGHIANSQGSPNDLLDRRDHLLNELGELVNVTTHQQDDGSLSVFIGSGQSLVSATQANSLATRTEPASGRKEIFLETGSSSTQIGNLLNGGEIGGLLDARRELIDPARADLEQLAETTAGLFNEQHAKGLDLDGNQGGELFRVPGDSGALISLAVADPRKFAAATALSGTADEQNSGDASIASLTIEDTTDGSLLDAVEIGFRDNAGQLEYQIDGSGLWQTWSAGDQIEVNGWRLELSGTPADGDTLHIEKNTALSGDNGNVLALDALRHAPQDPLGGASLIDSHQQSVTRTGIQARQSADALEAQGILRDQAVAERERISGVNLDEEAANMMRLQQSYQAAAQAIATASTMFDTLIAATRR